MNKQEILEVLEMPAGRFYSEVAQRAYGIFEARKQKTLDVYAMLGYTNVCRNRCLYCGMRAGSAIPRYRICGEEVVESALSAKRRGFGHMFLIAGEDPGGIGG